MSMLTDKLSSLVSSSCINKFHHHHHHPALYHHHCFPHIIVMMIRVEVAIILPGRCYIMNWFPFVTIDVYDQHIALIVFYSKMVNNIIGSVQWLTSTWKRFCCEQCHFLVLFFFQGFPHDFVPDVQILHISSINIVLNGVYSFILFHYFASLSS